MRDENAPERYVAPLAALVLRRFAVSPIRRFAPPDPPLSILGGPPILSGWFYENYYYIQDGQTPSSPRAGRNDEWRRDPRR